jgi:hypothetical protein
MTVWQNWRIEVNVTVVPGGVLASRARAFDRKGHEGSAKVAEEAGIEIRALRWYSKGGVQKRRDGTFLLEAAEEVWESSHGAAKKL